MPILIDGHNLIGRLGGLALDDPDDEQKLVLLLVSYRARTHKAITVVFDPGVMRASARPRTRRQGGVEVIFAPSGSSADAVITRRVRRSRNPSEWLVVTSDQELAKTVIRLSARVRRAEDFAAELNALGDVSPERRETALSPEEVESWLLVFKGQR